MTIREIIESVNTYAKSNLSQAQKIECLSQLDMHIYEEVILPHEGKQAFMQPHADGTYSPRLFPYTSDSAELIAPPRFKKMYELYLKCEADYRENEAAKYAEDITLFQSLYEQFCAWYHRNHLSAQSIGIRTAPTYQRRTEYAAK